MYEKIYLDLKLDEDEYVVNIETKEKFEGRFTLYYWHWDPDGKYYDSPVYDDYKKFLLVSKGEKITIENLLKQKYQSQFVFVSKHEKLTKILPMPLTGCNTFYPIKINDTVAAYLNEIGLEHLIVKEKSAGTYLSRVNNEIATGFEILFFVDGDSAIVNQFLNEARYKVIYDNIKVRVDRLVKDGISVPINGRISKLNYDILLLFKLRKNCSEEDFMKIQRSFYHNEQLLVKYREAYLRELISQLSSLKSISDLNPDILYFGYANEKMLKEIYS